LSNVGVRSPKNNETRLVDLIEKEEAEYISSLKPFSTESDFNGLAGGNQGQGSPGSPVGNFLPLTGGQMSGAIAYLHEFVTLPTNGIIDASTVGTKSGRIILAPNTGTTDDLLGIHTEQAVEDMGRHIELVVSSANTITIKHQDPGASAGDRISTPGGLDFVINDGEILLVYNFQTSSWVFSNSGVDGSNWSKFPAVQNVGLDGYELKDVLAIDLVDSAKTSLGALSAPLGVGVRLTIGSGLKYQIWENITQLSEISIAGGLVLNNLDLTMGTGNIIGGGAGEGMTNIGHLDFVDNLATPASALSLYSDGTDLLANTGGGTVNLSNIGTGAVEFEDDVFRINDNLDNTKQLAFNIGLAVPTSTIVTWRAQSQSGEVAFTDVTQTFLGQITHSNSIHNIYSAFITLGDQTSDNLFVNAGLNTPLRWDVGASSPVGTAEFGIGRDGTKMEFGVPTGNTFGWNVAGATDVFSLSNAIATFTVPLTMGTNSITMGGAGEGATNIGVLTFVDNLATPGASVALYSDGTDLFSKSSINLNLNNLEDVTDIILRSGFNTSKLFFDGGGDTYLTGSGTSGRINVYNDNSNNIAFTTGGISLFGTTVLTMDEVVSDPTTPTTAGRFYVKVVGGNAEPWFIGDGTVATSLLGGGGGSQTPITSDIDYDNWDAFDINKLLFISTGGFSFPGDATLAGFTWSGTNLEGNVPAGDGYLLSVAGNQKFGIANTAINAYTDLFVNDNDIVFDISTQKIWGSGGIHFQGASFFFKNDAGTTLYSVNQSQWDFNDKRITGLNEVRFEDDADHSIWEMTLGVEGVKGLNIRVEEDTNEEIYMQHEGTYDLNGLRIRQRKATPTSATDGWFKYVWHNNGIHYFPLGGGMVIDSTVADGYKPTYGTLKIPFQSSSVSQANMDSYFGSIGGSIAIMNGSGSSPRFCVRSANGTWYQVAVTLAV